MKPLFIDTHCHLYEAVFDNDRSSVIDRAISAGVHRMIIQNVDETTIPGMLNLETAFPTNCFATMGLHPCSVNADFEKDLIWVHEWWAKRNFVAVGETGLDYFWDLTFKEEQKIAFRKQVQLAKSKQVPVIIHSRNAFDDCLKIIQEEQDGHLKGIFHCFSDGLKEAQAAIDAGMHIGIGGTVTYKNSNLATVLPFIDLDYLVLETDAPYLPPVPNRGKRNESSYIPLVAEKIADLLKMSIHELATSTTRNAEILFSLKNS